MAVALGLYVHVQVLQFVGDTVCPIYTQIVTVVMPLTILIFVGSTQTSPGYWEKRPVGRSAVEEFLCEFDTDTLPTEKKLARICTSCWVLKDFRTKHSPEADGCVREFDHYCGWLGIPIGRDNHRTFCALLAWDLMAQHMHFILICICAYTEAANALQATTEGNTTTDDTNPGVWSTLTFMAANYTLVFISGISHVMTIPWLWLLGGYHTRLILRNLTTNEVMNMNRYDHFWVTNEHHGHAHREFMNPFDKGSAWNNVLDFFWWRTRGEFGTYKRVPTVPLEEKIGNVL